MMAIRLRLRPGKALDQGVEYFTHDDCERIAVNIWFLSDTTPFEGTVAALLCVVGCTAVPHKRALDVDQVQSTPFGQIATGEELI